MLSRVVSLLAAVSLVLLADAGQAGKPKPVTVTNLPPTQNVNIVGGCTAPVWLAGFTASQLAGDQGLLSFAAACAAEFPGSRVCSTRDVARTTGVPIGLAGTAWVVPELISAAGTISDGVTGNAAGLAQSSTCSGWSQGNGATGHLTDAQGRIRVDDCAQARSVACCAGS